MCLGVPGKVISLCDDGRQARIDTMGVLSLAGIELAGPVAPGDYVMVHAGQAIEKIDLAEAAERIKLWEEILQV
jgi:hydrogenase expression/formation protein HypC